MATKVLIYGANGYMGRLITQYALNESWNLVLAGRSEEIQQQADALGVSARIFNVTHLAEMALHLTDIDVVINVAGPMLLTGEPLANACIQTHTHYLDIAGEVPEFERLYQLNEAAHQAGVMLLPGVGFGVVPTDLLALTLKQRLPSATHLTLAYATEGGVSQGTLKTVLKDLCKLGVKRSNGELVPAKPGQDTFTFEVMEKTFHAVTNPWRADLFTAFLTTGITNIETYSVFPAPLPFMMRHPRWFKGVLQSQGLKMLINQLPVGPSETERSQGQTYLYGKATDLEKASVQATIIGPEAYLFSALTAILICNRVLSGQFKAGFQTVGQVYEPTLLDNIKGVHLSIEG